jgi:hypothetical protein
MSIAVMANYHTIKAQEKETTKNYSEKKMRRYMKAHKILLALYSELFFWGISWIPFILFPLIFGLPQSFYLVYVLGHFLIWEFRLKKEYHKMCDNDISELYITIEVLKDIQEERQNLSSQLIETELQDSETV